jgi:hypothetical protein
MRALKTLLSAAILIALTTCGGDNGPSGPELVKSCDATFGTGWQFLTVATCVGSLSNGTATTLSFDQGSCRLTVDVTPAALAAQGKKFTMAVNFGDGKATITKTGTECDGDDKGKITGVQGNQYLITFTPSASAACCQREYQVELYK